MPEVLSEYQIIQNEVLGAHALWEFAKYYNDYNVSKSNPELMLCFPVLPIVFNKRATKAINSRSFKEGSLYRTINDNKDIYTGLQERMEYMAPLTFKSLRTAFSVKLLGFDSELSQVVPFSKTFPLRDVNAEYQEIIHSSRRVGAWFGQLDFSEISVYFNIHF